MKKTATLMASLLVLAMASPLAACGSKSATDVYTEVKNAVKNFSIPQSHAVFYEQELYHETATSIERRYMSEQDNVSKEENLFSSLNTYKNYTAMKNAAGEITSEQEWESCDYSTVRQFGGVWYRTHTSYSTTKADGEIINESCWFSYTRLENFETHHSAVSMVLNNAVTHGGWILEHAQNHVNPETSKAAMEAYSLCLAEDIVAEQTKDEGITVNLGVSHKEQNGASVVAFTGTMNRKEQTRYKNGRSDWTRKDTLKAKKGKLVEVERYVEENFVSVEDPVQNYKTTEWARVTYAYKFNKKMVQRAGSVRIPTTSPKINGISCRWIPTRKAFILRKKCPS